MFQGLVVHGWNTVSNVDRHIQSFLYRLLNLALNSSVVRLQDVYRVFSGVGGNSVGGSITWDFINERIDDIRTA